MSYRDVRVIEKGDRTVYQGKLEDKIQLGKNLIVHLNDGRHLKIVKITRALMDVESHMMMVDSGEHRRFRIHFE